MLTERFCSKKNIDVTTTKSSITHRLMLSAQWNNWPKQKTLLQECKSERFADQA